MQLRHVAIEQRGIQTNLGQDLAQPSLRYVERGARRMDRQVVADGSLEAHDAGRRFVQTIEAAQQ